MITGIGTDIVHIPRIEALLSEFGDAFVNKSFTEAEKTYAEKKSNGDARKHACYLAKRWAAKEAVVKALGTGFGNGTHWRDIEITNNAEGQPHVIIHSNNAFYHNLNIHISMSDDYPNAVAFAIVSSS